MPDEVADHDGDRPHRDRIGAAIGCHIDGKVQRLPWPASSGDEHFDAVGHAPGQLRAIGLADEHAAAGVGEQHRGLSEPATEGDAVRCGQRADARAREEDPSEAHLERAHPTGVALGAHARDDPRDPRRPGRGRRSRARYVRREQLSAVDLSHEPAREDMLARHGPVGPQAEHAWLRSAPAGRCTCRMLHVADRTGKDRH